MFICQSRKSRDGSRERSQWNWFTSKFWKTDKTAPRMTCGRCF
jgi:hypothetical protein